MPKLPVLKPRQAMAVLEKAGFRRVRQRGSHVQFKRGNLLVTVPNHPGDFESAHPSLNFASESDDARRVSYSAEIRWLVSERRRAFVLI